MWVANETFECVSLEIEGRRLSAVSRDQLLLDRVSCPWGHWSLTHDHHGHNWHHWHPVTAHWTHLELLNGRVDQRRLGHPHMELLPLKHRRVVVHIPEANVNLLVTRPEI